MKFLTFRLSGPLASYGEVSRWDNRDTADMPTKSAVIGLLGCCFGYARGSDPLARLDQRLRLAVRCEAPGRIMTDFHTVTGPNGILSSEHKVRCSTIITPKQYLQDSAFQVFLYGDDELLGQCADAMRHPRWVISLGRRGCVPSIPVIPAIIEGDSVESVLSGWFDPGCEKRSVPHMRCEVEPDAELSSDIIDRSYKTVRRDSVSRADINLYNERTVRIFTVERS